MMRIGGFGELLEREIAADYLFKVHQARGNGPHFSLHTA
jgi:hypothetical protein